MPNSPQSPDTWQNSDAWSSDLRIFGQFFINKNCHDSRISGNIDMKLRSATKLEKRKKVNFTEISTMASCW